MRWIGGGVDKRNLEIRRQGYYAVKDVPAKLVPLVGRKRLRVSLQTRDHREALLRRPAALASIQAKINKAAGQQQHVGMVRLVAEGRATPLARLVEPWLAEKDIEERSKAEYRTAVSELVKWAERSHILPVLEAFGRTTASSYVTDLRSRIVARATLNKRLSCLSSLWVSLLSKGLVDSNPWRGHETRTPGRKDRLKEPERPFTDAEVRKLLVGCTDTKLLDLMHLGALSGMRLEEMAMLRVKDFNPDDKTLSVRDPKTPAGRRSVPVHPEVLPAILARTTDVPKERFVFAELGDEPKAGRQRSMAVSKRFARHRKSVGVHEGREGQRRSLVNFHSFRRWFITTAEQAGIPESTIKSVVGHKRAGMTFGLYSGGPSLQQRRTCVEAVKLP